MKKLDTFLFTFIVLFTTVVVSAQDTLVVDQGLGTLNAAIEANGGNKIYKLKAGQWYGLDKTIENVDYHLQIVGEPYDDQTLPATIQTGTKGTGEPLDLMFDAKGPITLKNVYIVNADLNGQIPGTCIVQSDSGSHVMVWNSVIDPVGNSSCITMTGGNNDLWFTDNIMARHGHMLGANDGTCFNISSDEAPAGADTVWIENNTFIDIGMLFMYGTFGKHINNLILINHNTFVHSKSQLDWSIFENENYLTNNLFFDFMTSGYLYIWQPMPGADIDRPKPMLIYSDTLPNEQLPSQRISYIQFNHLFRHESFYELIAEMNEYAADSLSHINLHPFIWDGLTPGYFGADPDSAFKDSREGHLYNHANNVSEGFPMFKYGNYVYDHDPKFNDQRIYQLSDSLREWQRPSTYIHTSFKPSTDFPEPSTWAKWHWDPDGDPAINDTWPLFDGTYTDEMTLTYSVAGLPLGDLNWWPEKKALWEANKDVIFTHMKAGNTDRLSLTSVVDGRKSSFSFSRVYPNPLTESATIEFTLQRGANVEISVFNPIGQCVRQIIKEYKSAGTHMVSFERGDLQNGVYFYTIRAGNRAESHKILIAQ